MHPGRRQGRRGRERGVGAGQPLINVSASTSRTETYTEGGTHGVRGTNTIGDISIGGTVGPLTTPKLVIKGLQTTADAFNTPQGYGHDEGFTFASISLSLLDNTVVQSLPPELQQLLAPLDQVSDTVFTGTQQAAQQVFQVLSDVTEPIQIPGLGSIALGYENGRANDHNAQSQASALRIEVTAGDRRQLVELGTARVRMGGPAPVGVFRSGGTAMDYQALEGALTFGNVEHKALPCQGSRGRTQTYRVPHASQLVPVPVLLDGVTYQVNGDQFRAKKVAKGWSRTAISSVSIPSAQLVITDVSSRAAMRQKAGKRVRSKVSTAIGSITVAGQPVEVPAPGGVVELPGGVGRDPAPAGRQRLPRLAGHRAADQALLRGRGDRPGAHRRADLPLLISSAAGRRPVGPPDRGAAPARRRGTPRWPRRRNRPGRGPRTW